MGDARAALIQAEKHCRQVDLEEGRRAIPRSRHDLPSQTGLWRTDGGMVRGGRLRTAVPCGVRSLCVVEGRLLRQRLLQRFADAADARWRRSQFPFVDRDERRAVARVLDRRARGLPVSTTETTM